jgi:hypothetical protein
LALRTIGQYWISYVAALLKEQQFQVEAAEMVEAAKAETPRLIMIASNLPHTIAQEGLPALRWRPADVNGSEF